MEVWDPDPDIIVDQLIKKYDETSMPLPDFECEPHLLISKVRKHYMEYVIKLLSVNYENNQKLLNKNIYLPSAIWRCAKSIETSAVQASMVVQLYRKNIQSVIKELKNDTKKGKLNKKLYECLHRPPENEKKTQTEFKSSGDCNCQCKCNDRKKRRRISSIPTACVTDTQINNTSFNNQSHLMPKYVNSLDGSLPPPIMTGNVAPEQASLNHVSPPKATIPEETPYSDELAEQLEKLFHSDPNDDDLFEGTLCTNDYIYNDTTKKVTSERSDQPAARGQDSNNHSQVANNPVVEAHEAKIKSLDERVASLAGLLASTNDNPVIPSSNDSQSRKETQRPKRNSTNKWLCEEYFLKVRLYELLDMIRETNRMGHMRIKDLFCDLFGDDSDDDGMVSPLEETPEFVISCRERIAPWVVKLLTPYYVKGRIRGKALFKALAKHLIKLIYQCSRYPNEHEVSSFVADFLENHKMIRCEADFKQFRIDNL